MILAITHRDFVSQVMHTHDGEAFEGREPTSKRIFRVPKVPIGIHERWSADGHDKLYKIGFPIWAVVDDATSKWLDAWVVPSNRMGHIIGYLFLSLVEKYGGNPVFLNRYQMLMNHLLQEFPYNFRLIVGQRQPLHLVL